MQNQSRMKYVLSSLFWKSLSSSNQRWDLSSHFWETVEQKANRRAEFDMWLMSWRVIAVRLLHDVSSSNFPILLLYNMLQSLAIVRSKGGNRRWSVRVAFSAFLTSIVSP